MAASTSVIHRYVALELRRTYRDISFVIFGIGTPVLMYLLFTNIGRGEKNTPEWSVTAMVGLAAYGALSAGLTSGSAVAEDKAAGWLRQLRITPMTPAQVIVGRTLTGSLVVLPAIVVVLLTGAIVNGVHLEARQWLALTVLLWIGSLPFTVLGIANGYQLSAQTTNVTNIVCNLLLALVGGLWFPLSEFPGWLAALARWTPGNRFAELGWNTVNSTPHSLTGTLTLIAWLAVFGIYAATAYRRTGRTA
ncbi:ABC transporter permease [Streptomyces sp. NPDC019990]|uniref:ABC transporter permease n=1 Tax=Streptomyces sp. NPDC019990 TaxID=3154693 RepID=UPI0034013E3D